MDESETRLERFLDSAIKSGLLSGGVLATALVAGARESSSDCNCDTFFAAVKNRLIDDCQMTTWQADKLECGKWRGFFVDDYVLLEHVVSDNDSMTYSAKHIGDGRPYHLSVTAGAYPLQFEVEPVTT
ncbi:MAG: hypothetical protein KDA44_07945 [Planctomycetales bacterium]|nr:hypothetical protein [Planctomycetales bacterium]